LKGANIPLNFLTWIVKKDAMIKFKKCNVQIIDIGERENVASL